MRTLLPLPLNQGGSLTVAIVDDEPLAVRRLQIALERIPAINLVGAFTDPRDALARLEGLQPQVIFLDVIMPHMDGFTLLENLRRRAPTYAPVVIFVSAHNEHALRAFKFEAMDYLEKPASTLSIRNTFARVRKVLGQRDSAQRIRELEEAIAGLRSQHLRQAATSNMPREFWVRVRDGLQRVPVQSIRWVEADRDYVRLHTTGGAVLLKRPISDFAQDLDPEEFMRVHRSTIVRRSLIQRVERGPAGVSMIMDTGQRVQVGRSYREAVQVFTATKTA